MRRFLVSLVLLFAQGSAMAGAGGPPEDVSKFLESRERCDHFRGEDSDDPARRKQILDRLNLYCKGSDARLKSLRKKYRTQPSVIKLLAHESDKIE